MIDGTAGSALRHLSVGRREAELRSKIEALETMKSGATARVPSGRDDLLAKGRAAFRKKEWGAAFAQLSAADGQLRLEPEDLVELAQSALLIGREGEGLDFLARAHQIFAEREAYQPAARCAFWIGFMAMLNGEFAKGGGWLARAARAIEGYPDCVEQGYLLLPAGYSAFHSGDTGTARAKFLEAAAIGKKFGESDLITLGLQGQGRALIREGEIAQGLALLDEAMVAVTAGEVSALNVGGVFCSVLDACGEIFDLQRAHEWTTALERWCSSQPDLVPYRGHCQIRRAELLHFHGEWPAALKEAERAAESLSRPAPKPAVGGAYYLSGEIYRMRGEYEQAQRAYDEASRWQSSPGPGAALLRLERGDVEAAGALIRRMMDDVREPGQRARMLEASVEIALAAHELGRAEEANAELSKIARSRNIPFLNALAHRSSGALQLAKGEPRGALPELRQSWKLWCELRAPYEAARTRVLLGSAYTQLGDAENARVEFAGSREVFQQLGATKDVAKVDRGVPEDGAVVRGPLTKREVEVLRLVASGRTNRKIASELHISEKTVARHVSNIFTKLDLSSRTAAAAYAYDHGLV